MNRLSNIINLLIFEISKMLFNSKHLASLLIGVKNSEYWQMNLKMQCRMQQTKNLLTLPAYKSWLMITKLILPRFSKIL